MGPGSKTTAQQTKGAKIEKLVPVTLNVYEVGELAKPRWTVTREIKMPYRPSANAKCAAKGEPGKWDRMGTCFNGKLFKIHFSLAKVMGTERVPAEWIISVAYNTTDFGYSPTHEAGDVSDNLNVATSPETPELGTDPLPEDAFITSALRIRILWEWRHPGVPSDFRGRPETRAGRASSRRSKSKAQAESRRQQSSLPRAPPHGGALVVRGSSSRVLGDWSVRSREALACCRLPPAR